jgi:WD40 repeat protein
VSVDTVRGTEPFAPSWSAHLDDYVTSLRWSPDGDLVASASLGGAVRLLSGADGREVERPPGHSGGALVVAWSPDGTMLASGGQDGVVGSWDRSRRRHVARVTGTGWVGDLAWSATSARLAAAVGREVVVLDDDQGTLAPVQRWADQPSTVTSVLWSPDGRQVGAGHYGGVRWFEPGTPEAKRAFDWKGSVLRLALAPNGKWLASGNQDHSVHIWRLWSGDQCEMAGYPVKVEHLAWHHRSRWLAVGNVDDITVWDFSGKGPRGRRPKVLPGVPGKVTALAYQPGGDVLAAGSSEGALLLWASSRPNPPRSSLAVGDPVSALDWSPDGTRVVVGTATGTVAVLTV